MNTAILLILLPVVLLIGRTDGCGCRSATNRRATCELLADPADPESKRGTVTLEQNGMGSNVKVTVDIKGVTIESTSKEKGLHVHEGGNIHTADKCKGVGGHYNPKKVDHGSRTSAVRHPGDFGNIKFSQDGKCSDEFEVGGLTLFGKETAVGRSIVLHENKDDLGKGGNPGSRASGNAGPRIACCEIK